MKSWVAIMYLAKALNPGSFIHHKCDISLFIYKFYHASKKQGV